MSPSRSGFGAGNAVADDVVDRGADRLGVAAVVERRGDRRRGRGRTRSTQIVEVLGGDAGLDVLGQHVQRLGGQPAGLAHALEGLAAVQADLAVARLRAVDVEVVHGPPGDRKKRRRSGTSMEFSAIAAPRNGTCGREPHRRRWRGSERPLCRAYRWRG